MIRTQIYLTEDERRRIDIVAKSTGKKQSAIIREAVDRFLDQSQERHRATILQAVAGMWRHRTDLRDIAAARRSWDRC